MDNKYLAEKVFALATALRPRNTPVAQSLENAIVSLLEYRKPLTNATSAELIRLPGVGVGTADLILRVLAGEEVESIVLEVPEMRRAPSRTYRSAESRESTQETKYGVDL